PTRREIGHGALAEKALLSVIPSKEEFPYTIRVVSEILESNGSSSMATVSAASLSLMDAGVPIKKPVGGIALGLVKGESSYVILTDIAGVEDHYGDMDFKVAGTEEGITAIQLDLKIDGLDYHLIQESLERAKQARLLVLKKMNDALALPREEISKYAPKIKSFKIDLDKIGEVIGPGGKTIRRIIREYNVTIDIDDETGIVSVVAETDESLNRAIEEILNLTKEVQVGDIFTGKIAKIVNFGAFCEIMPGKVGLIHISEISDKYVKDIRDFVKEGDIVKVKVINIDSQGRLTLSMKQVP
ncbi:MAG TPA: S1 RNA-binding domain-containing protein, partial [Candidatus Omnitrophica bacterium]|nr:S1 RNA-binding domain-containing protein [Candidatus Omnitrophota bacterium]